MFQRSTWIIEWSFSSKSLHASIVFHSDLYYAIINTQHANKHTDIGYHDILISGYRLKS